MNVAVILVAAGNGVRLGAAVPKAFATLAGEPLLAHALRGILASPEIAHVVIVAPASHLAQATSLAELETRAHRVAGDNRDLRADVVAGGADRTASVAAGLAALRPDDGIVLVHDAARALTPTELFHAVIHQVRSGHPAVVPGLAVTDTIKQVDAMGRVVATPARDSLRSIQTPQGFLREVLEHAHSSGSSATDDAALVESIGGHVRVIDGDARALKVTSPDDLAIAARWLQNEGV